MRSLGRSVVVALLLFGTALLIAVASRPAEKDYISYWSAGKQLVRHLDPYSLPMVLGFEKTQGYAAARPLAMRNPPWALFVSLPLGYVSARVGLVLWTLAAVACVVAFLCLYKVGERDRALVFCFAPVFASLAAGQSSPFLLLGVSLFLVLHTRRPALAGLGLLFMAFKPHLFFLFWPLLLMDCLLHRRWRLAVAFALALSAATTLALCLDAHVWPHYFAMMHGAGLQEEFVPTPSSLLRLLLHRNAAWIQFVPCALALVWALLFYRRRALEWDWRVHSIPLLFVGLWASPYAWSTDEIVLLPAITTMMVRPDKPRHAAAILLAINALLVVMFAFGISLTTGAYVWTSTAWLSLYLYSSRIAQRARAHLGSLLSRLAESRGGSDEGLAA